MRLDDYLKAIKECPDEVVEYLDDSKEIRLIPKLTHEFGVYNHFSIHMNANYDGIVKRFKNSVRYIMMFDIDGSLDTQFYTMSRRDIVHTSIIPYFSESLHNIGNYAMTVELFMHDYARTDNSTELQNRARAIANVVDEIGGFIIKENIPACLPYTIGWKYRDSQDSASRIVTHKPTSSVVSEYLRINT